MHFLVDANYTYVQEVLPRVKWLKPLPYEINVDDASTKITALLVEEIDKDVTSFGNYEEANCRIKINLQTTLMIKKKKKR